MVQIVREEGDEEYWQRPLREAIMNIGNSWAGALIRKQNHAASYAKAAANRAHEAYIAQIGINSREKISKNQLSAAKARNATLDKQFAESSRLAQNRDNREAAKWDNTKQNQLYAIGATEASQELLQAQNEFLIETSKNGKESHIVLNKLTSEARKELEDKLAKDPDINAAFFPLVKQYRKRQATIMGRLNFLRSLQKTSGDNAISQILEKDQPIKIDQLKGLPGSDGYKNLQALASKVTDDQTWSDILDSYNLDKDAITNMPQYLNDEIAEYGQMVSNNNLEHTEFKKYHNTVIGKGNLKTYGGNLKYFQKDANTDRQFADALLAQVGGENLNNAQKDKIKNTSSLLNAGVVNFMHKTHGIFTNGQTLGTAIMKDVSRLVQDPEKANTDLDTKLLMLAEGGLEQDQQKLLVRDILKDFIAKNNYVKDGIYKSAFGGGSKKEKDQFKASMVNWIESRDEPEIPDPVVTKNKIELRKEPTVQDPSVSPLVSSQDVALDTFNEYMNDALYGGKLDVINQGVVKGTKVDITDPQVATSYMFSQDPEIKETETAKILQGVVKFKKGLFQADKFTAKTHKVYDPKAGKSLMASMEDIYDKKHGIDAYNKLFVQGRGPLNAQDMIKARAEQERVREMYRYNRDVALQVLLNSQDQVPLFTDKKYDSGEKIPAEWYDALTIVDPDTGTVFNMDENLIAENFDGAGATDTDIRTAKQLRFILKAMNMGHYTNVAGDEFSVSKQLRLLKDAIVRSQGNANYRHAKVSPQQSTQIAAGP